MLTLTVRQSRRSLRPVNSPLRVRGSAAVSRLSVGRTVVFPQAMKHVSAHSYLLDGLPTATFCQQRCLPGVSTARSRGQTSWVHG